MQKFTIFTIIFAVIVLSITAELVVQDYLSKLYPPSSAANLLRTLDDLEGSAPVESTDSEQEFDNSNEPDQPETDSEATEPEADIEDTEPTVQGDFKISESIVNLLPTIDIDGLQYSPVNFDGSIFQVIKLIPGPVEINPDEVALGQLDATEGAVGAIYEIPLANKQEARKLYIEIKNQAKAISTLDVNETNQFGENSFYLNHQAKVSQVFVITVSKNKVYALGYSKEYHETFKPFLGLLL